MNYRVRTVVIAAALALVAALLTGVYVTNVRKSVEEGEEGVVVYVAARDIAAGTSGSEAAASGLLKMVEIDRKSVAPGAISAPSELEGMVAVDPVYTGEQVSTRRFRAAQGSGLRAELSGNLRALQVPGSQHQLLAGILRSGDRIDVVASIAFRVRELAGGSESAAGGEVERMASRVVLRDILVLRGPRSGSGVAEKVATGDELSVVLAVTDTQAQKLFFVMRNGDWLLQLRPVQDPADSPESVETVETVIGDGLKLNQLRQLAFGWLRSGLHPGVGR